MPCVTTIQSSSNPAGCWVIGMERTFGNVSNLPKIPQPITGRAASDSNTSLWGFPPQPCQHVTSLTVPQLRNQPLGVGHIHTDTTTTSCWDGNALRALSAGQDFHFH